MPKSRQVYFPAHRQAKLLHNNAYFKTQFPTDNRELKSSHTVKREMSNLTKP